MLHLFDINQTIINSVVKRAKLDLDLGLKGLFFSYKMYFS